MSPRNWAFRFVRWMLQEYHEFQQEFLKLHTMGSRLTNKQGFLLRRFTEVEIACYGSDPK